MRYYAQVRDSTHVAKALGESQDQRGLSNSLTRIEPDLCNKTSLLLTSLIVTERKYP
jgi:hypothetical protein